MRWLRRLADADLALDRTMIPLGSCTMKLNAAAEMEPITWPGFADLHPFAPDADAAGILELIADLERWLAELTGYAAVSLQPNAGSQGEFAGLLAIARLPPQPRRGAPRRVPDPGQRARHQRGVGGDGRACGWSWWRTGAHRRRRPRRPAGQDRRARATSLAALMITYPSTHGVYEARVREVCDAVHDAGGQVYVDGANLNALVGLARPGRVRRRRQPPQPAQDVLHPARRRRARGRAGGGGRAPGAVPARPRRWWVRSRPPRTAAPACCRSPGPTCG